MNRSTPGLPVHHHLPEFTQTHVLRVRDAIQPSHPRSSPSPPAPIPPSIRVFSNESTLRMRCPKYWSFSFSIIPCKGIKGLISFRMDWLDLPAVQGTLKSLLQHHSSKASILRCSAFFTIQLLQVISYSVLASYLSGLFWPIVFSHCLAFFHWPNWNVMLNEISDRALENPMDWQATYSPRDHK